MDLKWTPFPLITEALERLTERVSPVGSVLATRGVSQERGTAFFVHPRFALTAAHVVTFGGDRGTTVAERLRLDFGGIRCSPGSIAVPQPWLTSTDPRFDFALLRFDDALCPPELTYLIESISEVLARAASAVQSSAETAKAAFSIAAMATAKATAQIVGFHANIREDIEVAVEQTAEELRYLVRNLPGHSGAPISMGSTIAGRPIAIGLHTRYSDGDGRGSGLIPSEAQLRDAIALLDTSASDSKVGAQ